MVGEHHRDQLNIIRRAQAMYRNLRAQTTVFSETGENLERHARTKIADDALANFKINVTPQQGSHEIYAPLEISKRNILHRNVMVQLKQFTKSFDVNPMPTAFPPGIADAALASVNGEVWNGFNPSQLSQGSRKKMANAANEALRNGNWYSQKSGSDHYFSRDGARQQINMTTFRDGGAEAIKGNLNRLQTDREFVRDVVITKMVENAIEAAKGKGVKIGGSNLLNRNDEKDLFAALKKEVEYRLDRLAEAGTSVIEMSAQDGFTASSHAQGITEKLTGAMQKIAAKNGNKVTAANIGQMANGATVISNDLIEYHNGLVPEEAAQRQPAQPPRSQQRSQVLQSDQHQPGRHTQRYLQEQAGNERGSGRNFPATK